MKNIIHLMGMDSSKYGSFEKFNIELAKQLAEKGYHSVFVYEKWPDVEQYANDLQETGAEIRVIPCNKANKWAFCKALWQLMKEYNFQMMHAHFTQARFYGIPLAYMFGIRNIVYTMHSTMEPLTQIKLHTRLWYWWTNRHSKIIAVSKQIEQTAKQNWPHAEVKNLYMGINPIPEMPKTACRKALQIPEDKTIVLCTANFNHVKGLDILCHAVKQLADSKRIDDTLVYIVGQPKKDIEELQSLIVHLGIADYMRLEGISNRIPEYLRAADIYVQPSRHEGLPLSLMEACSTGLPIVATRVGGIPEVAREGENAYLFAAENADELAKYMVDLIDNKQQRGEMGQHGVKVFQSDFEIKNNVSKIIDDYRLQNEHESVSESKYDNPSQMAE